MPLSARRVNLVLKCPRTGGQAGLWPAIAATGCRVACPGEAASERGFELWPGHRPHWQAVLPRVQSAAQPMQTKASASARQQQSLIAHGRGGGGRALTC